MDFEDDLTEMSRLGLGPETVDRMSSAGFTPGALAEFMALAPETRRLVLRLLDHPTDADFAELEANPTSKGLAAWLLTLPAYTRARVRYDDDDEDA